MKKLYISLLLGLTSVTTGLAQHYEWVATVDNGENHRIAVDPSGNIYVYGTFNTAVVIGTHTFNSGDGNGYLAVYNTTGSVLNAVQLKDVAVKSMKATPGSLYVSGNFAINGRIGATTISGGLDGNEAFFAQIDPSLNVGMVKTGVHFGTNETFAGMDVDNSGNIYIATGFRGDSISIDADHFTGADEKMKALLLKFSPAGTLLFSRLWEMTGNADIAGDDIVVNDATGTIYITGESSDDADPDSVMIGTIKYKPSPNYPVECEFFGVFTSTGDALAFENITSIYQDGISDVALDNSGNPYITVSHYVNGYSLIKLNNAIDTMWTSSAQGGSAMAGRALHIDVLGNIYVAGDFNGTSDFPGTAHDYSPPAFAQGFIALYTTGGMLQDVYMIDSSDPSYVNAIGSDVTGSAYAVGRITGSTNFSDTAVAPAADAAFLTKISSAVTSAELLTFDERINVFPNPAADFIYVKGISLKKEVKIYDMLGTLVYNNAANADLLPVSIAGFAKGVYLLQIIEKDQVINKYFIKK